MNNVIQRQRGAAVLTAMLVVTLGTVIAVNMMWNASLDLRRTTASDPTSPKPFPDKVFELRWA